MIMDWRNVENICSVCGEPFYRKHPCEKRCSNPKCKKTRACIARHKCTHCGKEFRPKESTRTTFCSAQCRIGHAQMISRERQSIRHIGEMWFRRTAQRCRVCGKRMFPTTTQSNHEHCSRECQLAELREYSRQSSIRKHEEKYSEPIKCKGCGIMFTPEYGSKRRVFCDKACAKRYAKRVAGATHRSRARKAGVYYETVNKGRVFKRDGYRCQLCGKKTRPDYNINHDLYPNIDHIVPLALGGEHSYKNTQCLCRACNIAKGADGTGDQLLLCG